MLCRGCLKNKLRQEFPPANVCDKDHALVHCMRCVMSSVEKFNHCPTCYAYVTKSHQKYTACVQKLKWIFPPLKVEEEKSVNEGAYGYSMSHFNVEVVMLNGDKNTLRVSGSDTVTQLKEKIQAVFGVEANKQRLLYNDKPLETYKSSRFMKLGDYNVTSNGTITLIKVLKTISSNLRNVTFDFFWEYVGIRRDFLNASAFLYSGCSLKDYVDFRNQFGAQMYMLFNGSNSVTHSGHGFRNNWHGRQGNHTIKVDLETLPKAVDKIFFTLSCLNAESIHDFRNLQLKFYDTSKPLEQLCGDKISRSVNAKAVVFCCLCHIDDCWQVFSLQEPSNGSVRCYTPLTSTIQNLIVKRFS